MTMIPSTFVRIGGGAIAAGAGIGAVALATRLSTEQPERRRLVSGVLAGVGGAAMVGAVLARSTAAFGPLLGAGIGLAGAGVADAIRAPKQRPVVPPNRLDTLKPGDLLPDGVQAAPTEVYRRGDELRFDAVIGNQGAAPLQLALRFDREAGPSRTTQVVFNEDGSATERDLTADLRPDERRDHSHLHFDDFAYFQLFRADEDDRADLAWGEVTGGVKQSFYLTDIQEFDVANRRNRTEASQLSKQGKVDRSIVAADAAQGISVGMADVYGSGLAGQALSLEDAAPGRYVLRQSFDPSDELLEQDERNNVSDTLLEIGEDGSVTMLGSKFAHPSSYVTLPDGRIVIPAVKESLDRASAQHRHAAGDERR